MKEQFHFLIETIFESGQGHYKVTNLRNHRAIHCNFGELNEVLYKMLGEGD